MFKKNFISTKIVNNLTRVLKQLFLGSSLISFFFALKVFFDMLFYDKSFGHVRLRLSVIGFGRCFRYNVWGKDFRSLLLVGNRI